MLKDQPEATSLCIGRFLYSDPTGKGTWRTNYTNSVNALIAVSLLTYLSLPEEPSGMKGKDTHQGEK